MPDIDRLKAQISFEDLTTARKLVSKNRASLSKTRLNFTQYVMLSHQLTETMRKEYPRLTGVTWNASAFSGWNCFTEAIRFLRRSATHESPIYLEMECLSVYPKGSLSYFNNNPKPENTKNRKYDFLSSGSLGVDQLSDSHHGEGLLGRIDDPVTGKARYVEPIRVFKYFTVCSIEQNLAMQISSRGRCDVFSLVRKSHQVYCDYYAYYRRQVKRNSPIVE